MLLATQIIYIPSLWVTTLLLAIFLPPAVYWVRHRRKWFHSYRGLLMFVFIAILSIIFISPDVQTLWEYRHISNVGINPYPWEIPLMIVITSSFVTFATTQQSLVDQSPDKDR